MGRERDRFWEYVEESGGHFLCKFCERRFSGAAITRIKSHLSGIRGRDVQICPKVPEDVQLAAIQAIGTPMNETGSLNFLNIAGETDQVISASASRKKAKRLHPPTNLGKGKKDKSVVDRLLAKFIISNRISLDVSKLPYLIDSLKSMAEFGPTYELPNSFVLGTQLIPDVYEEAEEHIKNVKKLSTTTGCSLVMSNVVENSNLECINIFAHTPVGLVYIQKIAVPEEGMTFDDFIEGILCAIEFWGPKNVVQCILNLADDDLVNSITDFGDDNFFLSVQSMILREYPWICLNRCANREFGLLLIFTYLTVPWIRKTIQLAKVIYKYLYEHNVNLTPRKEHARNKEYSFSGLTKIAVELFTLNSILEVEKELQALQLPVASEFCEGPSREDDVAKIVDIAIHSTEFWSRGRKVVRVLQPLFQVLDFIEGNGSTSGYLYEAMKRAEKALEQQGDADDLVHYETIRKMFKKWRIRVVHPIYAAAAFLSPAYFCSNNFTEDTEIQKGLELLTLLMPDGEQETLSKQVQLYRLKVPDLFSATAIKMLHTLHPRKWWECFGDHCPILQKVAVRILSQTCATPTCHVTRFQPDDLVDKLRMNTIMMEKYATLKSQNWEPIDLDKISGLPEYAHEVIKQYFEEMYWSDGLDYGDLFVINNPNNRLCSSSESNAHDDLPESSNQTDWLFDLGELGNLDDLLDMINQNDWMFKP